MYSTPSPLCATWTVQGEWVGAAFLAVPGQTLINTMSPPHLGLLALNEAEEVLQGAGNDAAKVGHNVVVLVLGAHHGVCLAAARLAAVVGEREARRSRSLHAAVGTEGKVCVCRGERIGGSRAY